MASAVTDRLAALRARLPANAARISCDLKEKLLKELNYKSVDDFYVDLVNIAKTFAVVPVSNFQVGVIGVTAAGDVYLGCNVELAGYPLNFSVHAEQCLIANLVRHHEEDLILLMVNWAPCGHCRQFLSECYKKERLQIRILEKGGEVPQDHSAPPHSIASLLPHAFGPGDLGIGPEERLLRARPWSLPPGALVPQDPMTALGLDMTKDGALHGGAYMENAAYNPSLSPMQSALTSVALSRRSFGDVTAVLLLELEGKISQEAVTRLILSAIAPTVNLRVFRLPAEHASSPSSPVS